MTQTAIKSVRKRCPRLSKLKLSVSAVGPQQNNDNCHEDVRWGVRHGGYAPPWNSAVPRASALAEFLKTVITFKKFL